MTTSMSIHHATGIVFERHMPGNGNAMTLVVEQKQLDGDFITRSVEITIYDLPSDVTDKIYSALGKPRHFDPRDTSEFQEIAA